MVLVLFMPSCTGAGEQKYLKKQWELNDFILAENSSGRHFLASCLRALVEDMRFSIANIDV